MVFFTCNHCGESLKKAAVEKHYQWKSCRAAPIFLTCVDCLKDFKESEYVAHTKCVTELERYSAKGFVGKQDKNKGAKKQEAWTESLQELTQKPNLDHATRAILERIASQTNVPRKKPKFINFLKSCMHYDMRKAEAVWTIIEEGLEDFNKRAVAEQQKNQNNGVESDEPNSNGAAETETVTEQQNGDDNDDEQKAPTWSDIIAHAASSKDLDKSLKKPLKKLQKCSDLPSNAEDLKRKKFVKFVQKSLEVETEVGDKLYDVFSQCRNILKMTVTDGSLSKSPKKRKHPENGYHQTAETSETDAGKKKKINRNGKENDGNTEAEANENGACDLNNSTFDWDKNISRVFKKHKNNNELDLAFLKSKVLKKYAKENEAGAVKLSHIEKKITKVIKKNEKFVVEDDIIKLRQ